MEKLVNFFLLVILISNIAYAGIFDSLFGKKREKQEVVEITYAKGKDTTIATTKQIETFNRKYEGKIKVKFIEMPSDTGFQHDVYMSEFSKKGQRYDIFDADVVWAAEFAQAGHVLAVDEYAREDNVKLSNYMKGPIDAVTYKGKIWGIPKYIDAGLLFYRKDIIDTPPKTWDELIDMAENHVGDNGTIYGYVGQAKQYEGLVCNAVEFIAAYGGEIVDTEGNIVVNSPETIKGLTKFTELLNKDFVPKMINNFTELESHTAFIEGQSIFIRNWPYQWALANDEKQSKVVGKVGVAPLPSGDLKSAGAVGGWITMISKYSVHPEEAWEFLKFLCGPEGQKLSAIHSGAAPTYLPLWEDKEVLEANPFFNNSKFLKALQSAVPRPVSPIYSILSDIMQLEISKAITGEITPKEAIENMERKMKDAAASYM